MASASELLSSQALELAKQAARLAFLNNLARRCPPPKKRKVKKRQGTRRLHCDILGNLPVELVHHIACYLPPIDIVSLRRVSRRWQLLLRTENLCRKVCLLNDIDSKQCLQGDMSWESLLTQKSCMMHSLVHGRPWSAAEWTLPLSRSEYLRKVIYYHGKLGYLCYDSGSDAVHSLRIFHFESGYTTRVPAPILTPRILGPAHAMDLSDSHFCCVLHRYAHPVVWVWEDLWLTTL